MSYYKLYICCKKNDDLRKLYEEVILDSKNYSSDSGFDIYTPTQTDYDISQVNLVDMEIQCKMVKINKLSIDNYQEEPTGFYLYPRSSIYKTPLTFTNSVGIIDAGYRGNIKVALRYNVDFRGLKKILESNIHNIYKLQDECIYTLPEYTRIAQICTPDLSPLREIKVVGGLDNTERGVGGFGSTGK